MKKKKKERRELLGFDTFKKLIHALPKIKKYHSLGFHNFKN
jgi:hypothetical protein